MKKLILTGLGFLFAITLTFAQEQQANAEQKAREKVATLTEKLTLTDEQQAAIYPIVLDASKTKLALKADTSLSADDLKQRMNTLKAENHNKVAEQLTDEQKERFTKYMEEKKSKD